MSLTKVDSRMVEFTPAGTGAVVRDVQTKLRESVSVKDFGAVGDGVTDDTAAIQAAINSFTNGTTCVLNLVQGANYKITSTLNTGSRSILINGNNATLTLAANATYLLQVGGTNVEVCNLSLNLNSGITATAAVYVTGLQHIFRNVTSRNQVWPVVFLCQDMKESHFTQIRVDSDTTSKTGIVFKFDYCVNNTFSDSMLGYCAQAFYGTSTAQPTFGYYNEGFTITNVVTVYAGKAVNFDNGTAIHCVNCVFDFTETIGVFVSNGTNLVVMGCWIASNTTNGFVGVGALAPVFGARVIGNEFVRGVSAITGTAGVSLPCTGAQVIGNTFQSGMNFGTVTASDRVIGGNIVNGGGLSPADQGSTFTPVLSFGGASVGMTYGAQVGTYKRDMNGVVTFQIYIRLTAKGSSTGVAVVSGIPYVLTNTTNGYTTFSARGGSLSAAGHVTGYITPNTQSITLEYATATGTTGMTDANFTNTSELIISGSYQS